MKSIVNDAKRVFVFASGMHPAVIFMMWSMGQVGTIQHSGQINCWRCRYATRCWIISTGRQYLSSLLNVCSHLMVYVPSHQEKRDTRASSKETRKSNFEHCTREVRGPG